MAAAMTRTPMLTKLLIKVIFKIADTDGNIPEIPVGCRRQQIHNGNQPQVGDTVAADICITCKQPHQRIGKYKADDKNDDTVHHFNAHAAPESFF